MLDSNWGGLHTLLIRIGSGLIDPRADHQSRSHIGQQFLFKSDQERL
jgi:hypothetical protein